MGEPGWEQPKPSEADTEGEKKGGEGGQRKGKQEFVSLHGAMAGHKPT